MPSAESPVTSPEMGRRRYNYYNANIINAPPPPPPHMHPHNLHAAHILNNNAMSRGSNQSALCNKRYVVLYRQFDPWTTISNLCVFLGSRIRDRHTRLAEEVVTIRRNSNVVYIWNWNVNVAV